MLESGRVVIFVGWHDLILLQNMLLFSFIEILKIIVEMFLPHMNHLTLEQTFFSQVLPKV